MTDVRLTATNPEDSSVVPVACNDRGELLLEEIPDNSFDGNVQGDLTVSGSGTFGADVNAQGDLNLGVSNNVALDGSTGSATFAGFAKAVGYVSDGSQISATAYSSPSGIGFGNFNCAGGVNNWFTFSTGYANGANAYIHFKTSWRNKGERAGIYFGAKAVSPVQSELVIGHVTSSNTDTNASIEETIRFGEDGQAVFAADVVVGSRSKQWMLVEQNGLCHMVEQARAITADLVDPAAADVDPAAADVEYPPLRDVFAELNAIERALGEVMEKLRMTPPAGWEVWDGSSENS